MKNPYTPAPIDPEKEKFYGRREYIDKILSSDDKMMLILGARRMGKSSLLKQIEYLSNPPSYIGVYLNVADIDTQEEFADKLRLSCKNEFFEQIEFDVEELRGENLFDSLSQLDKRLQDKGTQLLLLCDESEKFMDFEEPFLKSIKSFIRYDSQMIRLIFTASQGIYKLYETEWTPPFLHGVHEVTLSRLASDEAESLIRQVGPDDKPAIEVSNETVSKIQRLTDNQPFLIHCLCSVLYDDGSLLDVTEQHLEQVFESFPLSGFFFDLWKHPSPKQRLVLLQFREAQTMSENELSEKTGLPYYEIKLDLHELTRLCYIKKLDEEYQISNYFFEQWLNSLNSEEADAISAMDREQITQVEQQRALRVIADKGAASVYEIYLSSLLELHKLRKILEDFTKQGFINLDRTYNRGGRKVEYYSLTKEGRKLLAKLEKAS